MNGSSRLGEVYFALCKAVDSPVSLGLWLRFKHGEHEQLANISIRPEWYCTAWSFHRDYICGEFLSKYKGLNTGLDTKAVALQKFATAESSCKEANIRIRESKLRGFSPRVEAVIFTAQRKIASLLGEYNSSWLDMCKWGPGATFSLKGMEANLENKIREDPLSITAAALPYFRRVISDDYAWLRSRGIDADGPCCIVRGLSVTKGCRVTTVSKNAKTDRTIAIEPTANQFLQGGVGNFFRRRLLRVGIDLNDQRPNQMGAQAALVEGLATVDLKAASDTVSMELVFLLLPVDWALLLDSLRSKYYKLGDKFEHFEKFSTMGNGFTFELETLLFWALSSAVLEVEGLKGRSLVYGDDIILPDKAMPLLLESFAAVGLTVNPDKTHYGGQFFESCGKHYFGGSDVTPIYQKEVPDVLEELYRLANRIRRLAFRLHDYCSCDGVLQNAWLAAIRGVKIRHVTPIDSEDDEGLALPLEEIQDRGLCGNSNPYGISLPVLSFRARRFRISESPGLYAYWLRFTPAEQLNDKLRDSVAVRRHGKYVSRRRKYRVDCRKAPWV